MPPTDSVDPPVRPAPPAAPAPRPAAVPAASAAPGAAAPVLLERAADELDRIAEHWTATRATSTAELERARTVLGDVRSALHLLAESR